MLRRNLRSRDAAAHANETPPHHTEPSAPDRVAESHIDVADRLRVFAAEFDLHFERLLQPAGEAPPRLVEAARYTALSAGKRIRPYLTVRACELTGCSDEPAWAPAAAVECIHAFSLIHDDLPAMDDDDLRRGRPTCHKKFGEAIAILAGDALAVLPFELIARHVPDPARALRIILDLAASTGWTGMIGGQAVDILGVEQPPSVELAGYIHERKTASLFAAACRIGAIAAGADATTVERLGRFGQHLGNAFQIADDMLDIHGTRGSLGKPVGKDEAANKQSLPRCIGLAESRKLAERETELAIGELAPFGPGAEDLRELARFVIVRNY